MRPLRILLLDIDGVLVMPGGYRKSFRDTVNYFLAKFGFPDLRVDDQVAELFEYYGIPAEWDMVPLSIATFLEWYAENNNEPILFNSIDTINDLPKISPVIPFRDYLIQMIPEINLVEKGQIISAKTVFDHCQEAKEKSIFPKIWNDPILVDILAESLNFKRSAPFQVLETFVLGTELFEKYAGIPTEKNIPSNLFIADVPIISPQYQEKIAEENGKTLYATAMTARPNMLPETIIKPEKFVSSIPEADLAIEKLGWSDNVSITGVGLLHYYEVLHGLPKDSRLKPHAFHALLGTLYAVSDALEPSLTAMKNWESNHSGKNPFRQLLPEGNSLEIAVIEDSARGIQSADGAAVVLQSYGYAVKLYKYGIITSSEKTSQLEAQNAKIVPDVNRALTDFFSQTD